METAARETLQPFGLTVERTALPVRCCGVLSSARTPQPSPDWRYCVLIIDPTLPRCSPCQPALRVE
jgi:hypothetical protein